MRRVSTLTLAAAALAAIVVLIAPLATITVHATQPQTSRFVYANGDGRYQSLWPDDGTGAASVATDGSFEHDIAYSDLAPSGSLLYIRKIVLTIEGPQKADYGDAFLAMEDINNDSIFWHVLAEAKEVERAITQNFIPPTPMTSGQQLCLQARWRGRAAQPSVWGWTNTSTTRFVRLELEYHVG